MAWRWIAVVVRNGVPVAGVVALGWSAPHLLVAYFADTVLGMTGALALVLGWMSPPERGLSHLSDLLSQFLTALAVAAIAAIPLGGPVAFLLARDGFDVLAALEEPRFRNALLLQGATAALVFAREVRAQAALPLEALGLRERFGLFFVRWFALCAIALSPLGAVLGSAAGPVLIAVYAALTIFGEVAPRRMLAAFEGPPAPGRPRRGGRKRARRGRR